MPTVSPAGIFKDKITDDGLVFATLIFEADIFEADLTIYFFRHPGMFPIGEQGVCIQQIEGAVGGGHGALVEIEGVAQAGERPEQALGDEDQDGIDADRQRAGERHLAAGDQDGDEAAHDEHADERDEGGTERNGRAVGFAVAVAFDGDAPQFVGFGGEALDGGHAAQVVGQLTVEHADLLTDSGIARRKRALEADGAPDDEGHGQHGHPGHVGGRIEEDAADDQDGGDHLPDVVDAHIQEAFELVDVVVQDGQQAAGGAVFKVGQLEMLDVVVGVDAQFVLEGLRQVAPGDLIEILEQRFEDPDDDRQASQYQ